MKNLRFYVGEALLYLIFSLLMTGFFFAIGVIVKPLFGAPYIVKKQKEPPPLSVKRLQGVWLMNWNSTPCRVTLSPDGTYHEWFSWKKKYRELKVYEGYTSEDRPYEWVGTWGVCDGKLWITQRETGAEKFHTYLIGLNPATLTGQSECKVQFEFVRRLSSLPSGSER